MSYTDCYSAFVNSCLLQTDPFLFQLFNARVGCVKRMLIGNRGCVCLTRNDLCFLITDMQVLCGVDWAASNALFWVDNRKLFKL